MHSRRCSLSWTCQNDQCTSNGCLGAGRWCLRCRGIKQLAFWQFPVFHFANDLAFQICDLLFASKLFTLFTIFFFSRWDSRGFSRGFSVLYQFFQRFFYGFLWIFQRFFCGSIGSSFCIVFLGMVLHSKSPMIPTFRSDVRIFWVQSANGQEKAWFGGGADLTPYYLDEKDHGSLNVPIEHHPTIRYMVYNGYYFWWCPIAPSHGTFTNPWGHQIFSPDV